MAFNDQTKGYTCGRKDCSNHRKYFRMIESCRDQDSYTDEGIDGEQVVRHLRICEECELKSRKEEFPLRPARWRERYPNYCCEQAVHDTIRQRAKGDSWRMFAKKRAGCQGDDQRAQDEGRANDQARDEEGHH